MNMPKIGAHISVSGGLSKGALRAVEMKVECMQIFVGSPRRYEVQGVEESEIIKYKKIIHDNNISPVFIHASYLLNLASEDEVIREKSVKSLLSSLMFADIINAKGVIYHPGSPKGGDKQKAIEREAETAREVLKSFKGNALLIIENTAGKKKIGVNPGEISTLLEKINDVRTGVCIDTAHSLESGNIKDFSPEGIKKWIKDWERVISMEKIVALHVNDSKTDYMSQYDRHENIGEGFIGKQGFLNLALNGSFSHIPWILEVPGFDGKGPDKKNMEILRSVFDFSSYKK